MRNATERQLDFFLRYPTRKVVGVVDTPEQLERVLLALSENGIDRKQIMVFSGDEGIRCIDPAGAHHGLLGRLTRVVQFIGEELEHMRRYEEELRAGHFLVVVSVDGEEAKEAVRRVLGAHGGHFVDYYGPLMIQHLVP
ncbi:MAG TPA: hypothetical protein VNK43_09690 [Gemmatimonadales bacterium]|nr:hypothetical protein [Gemmatimonadales bacterium]